MQMHFFAQAVSETQAAAGTDSVCKQAAEENKARRTRLMGQWKIADGQLFLILQLKSRLLSDVVINISALYRLQMMGKSDISLFWAKANKGAFTLGFHTCGTNMFSWVEIFFQYVCLLTSKWMP